LEVQVTHGGAGAIFALFILVVLALPVILIWIFRGAGNFHKRRVIGFIQLAILVVSTVLIFTGIGSLQSIGFGTASIILTSMLLTPIIFNNRV
jgi:hypothetical protein